jgi:hypothetical protein
MGMENPMGCMECKEFQMNIDQGVMDKTDWVGMEGVHPHGLDTFVL